MDFLPTQRTATRSLLPVKSHLSTRNISIFYFHTPKSLLLYPLLYYLPLPGIALFWQCKSFSPGPPLLRYPLGPPVCALSRSSLSVPCPTLLCPLPLHLPVDTPHPFNSVGVTAAHTRATTTPTRLHASNDDAHARK